MKLLKYLKSKLSQIIMKPNRLTILRHGESEFNLYNFFCGWHDAPLSEGGINEAHSIAAQALIKNNFEFDIVYTSALFRARHTVDIVLSDLNLSNIPVKAHWRLNERHYGNLTGYNKREMADLYGEDQVQKWRRNYSAVPPPITPENRYFCAIANNPSFADVPIDEFPLSESMEMVVERVRVIWNEINEEVLKGSRVLICSHGTVVRALIQIIEGLTNEEISKCNIPNSIPIVFDIDTTNRKVIGQHTFLGDSEYVKEMIEKVASIGPKKAPTK